MLDMSVTSVLKRDRDSESGSESENSCHNEMQLAVLQRVDVGAEYQGSIGNPPENSGLTNSRSPSKS